MNDIIWDDDKKQQPQGGIVWDAPEDKFTSTAKSDSALQNVLASAGGAMYAPVLGVKQMLGRATPAEVKEWQDSMAGLWSTPGGKTGAIVGGVASAAPLAFVPGANTAAGAALGGLAYGASQPVVEGGPSRAAQAVEGMGGGVAGKYLGQALGAGASKLIGSRTANLAAQQAQNATRDATIGLAQDAGYALPPAQINPSAVNRALEGFAGKLSTAQAAAQKNQTITNNLVKREIGLPPEAPLTRETLDAVRQDASQAYQPLRQLGTINVDEQYAQDLNKIATAYDKTHGGMRSMRSGEVEGLLQDASTLQLDSNNALEFLRALRDNGFANKASPRPGEQMIGRTQLGIASAIENLFERKLAETGQADALTNYRNARTLIAKTYTVEKALNPATGNVQANKLAEVFKRGKPISGDMETVAKVATSFPAATKEITTSMPGVSPLDYLGGILTGGATGSPLAGMAAFARPVVRSGLLSDLYQKSMVQAPDYGVGLLSRIDGLNNAQFKKLLQSMGASVPLEQ